MRTTAAGCASCLLGRRRVSDCGRPCRNSRTGGVRSADYHYCHYNYRSCRRVVMFSLLRDNAYDKQRSLGRVSYCCVTGARVRSRTGLASPPSVRVARKVRHVARYENIRSPRAINIINSDSACRDSSTSARARLHIPPRLRASSSVRRLRRVPNAVRLNEIFARGANDDRPHSVGSCRRDIAFFSLSFFYLLLRTKTPGSRHLAPKPNRIGRATSRG